MLKKHLVLYLLLTMMILLASGCKGGAAGGSASVPITPAMSASQSPTPSTKDVTVQLEKVALLLKTLGNEKALLSIVTDVLPALTPTDAAKLVLQFEAYQAAAVFEDGLVDATLSNQLHASAQDYSEKELNNISAIQDKNLQQALHGLFDRGYKIVIPEGNYQAVIDYSAYKVFEASLPRDMSAYIELMAQESDARMAEDGGLLITPDEVLSRATACENFLSAYASSQKYIQVRTMYFSYVTAYLFGLNNTPAFDYTTNKLEPAFLSSYQRAVAETSDSPLRKSISAYLEVLKKENYTLTSAVTAYRKQLTGQLEETNA